jgi:hypothetical protein
VGSFLENCEPDKAVAPDAIVRCRQKMTVDPILEKMGLRVPGPTKGRHYV